MAFLNPDHIPTAAELLFPPGMQPFTPPRGTAAEFLHAVGTITAPMWASFKRALMATVAGWMVRNQQAGRPYGKTEMMRYLRLVVWEQTHLDGMMPLLDALHATGWEIRMQQYWRWVLMAFIQHTNADVLFYKSFGGRKVFPAPPAPAPGV